MRMGRAKMVGVLVAALLAGTAASGEDLATVAKAFGTRAAIGQASLSPDGAHVAFITAPGGATSSLMIADPAVAGSPVSILKSMGQPDKLRYCHWITGTRLACQITFLVQFQAVPVSTTRLIALDSDGKNIKVLTANESGKALDYLYYGGDIIDWTGDGTGSVLMNREYVPESSKDTFIHRDGAGLGVERVNTRTLARDMIERPRRGADGYITDGHGNVRIMGLRAANGTGYFDTKVQYLYRTATSSDWRSLSIVEDNQAVPKGFEPVAVDPVKNVAYGFGQQNGYKALFTTSLDGNLTSQPVLAQPNTDVDGLIRIGRQNRVVGVSYATERREIEYFDPDLRALRVALERALPNAPLVDIVDASADEQKLLLFAGSDSDPGTYYVLDRKTRHMAALLPVRPALEGRKLAQMQPIRFRAADGTMIPGYLTLPPGSSGKDLPAIVMPHGGPGSRDEWGFDWWAQFFAARGFAVLQPNFRGSTGYGNAWYQKNGFQSWRTAIGDVVDAGRWLKAQGIAAPGKLAIVGWSYGGYAALQSAVLDPDLYKAVIAVAPVTDLLLLKQDAKEYTSYAGVEQFVGDGPHVLQGSPAHNVAAIKAPVLIFHGTEDRNVRLDQSQVMTDRLRGAGKQADLVIFKGLDHQLDDSDARTLMLTRSDEFLRASLGLKP